MHTYEKIEHLKQYSKEHSPLWLVSQHVFQLKTHLPLANRKSNTYSNFTLE